MNNSFLSGMVLLLVNFLVASAVSAATPEIQIEIRDHLFYPSTV